MQLLEEKDLAPKTIRNIVATLSALFNFAMAPRRRWATSNPCAGVELPAVPETGEIRFLTLDELDALVGQARPGEFHALDRAIFLTAAMTGLRKGELLALRWKDVDWLAARVRVRQNYVRGEFGTPLGWLRTVTRRRDPSGSLILRRHEPLHVDVFGSPRLARIQAAIRLKLGDPRYAPA